MSFRFSSFIFGLLAPLVGASDVYALDSCQSVFAIQSVAAEAISSGELSNSDLEVVQFWQSLRFPLVDALEMTEAYSQARKLGFAEIVTGSIDLDTYSFVIAKTGIEKQRSARRYEVDKDSKTSVHGLSLKPITADRKSISVQDVSRSRDARIIRSAAKNFGTRYFVDDAYLEKRGSRGVFSPFTNVATLSERRLRSGINSEIPSHSTLLHESGHAAKASKLKRRVDYAYYGTLEGAASLKGKYAERLSIDEIARHYTDLQLLLRRSTNDPFDVLAVYQKAQKVLSIARAVERAAEDSVAAVSTAPRLIKYRTFKEPPEMKIQLSDGRTVTIPILASMAAPSTSLSPKHDWQAPTTSEAQQIAIRHFSRLQKLAAEKRKRTEEIIEKLELVPAVQKR